MRRVAVIGGGLAGVTAALALVDAGAEVALVERRGRLGGLTWSFERGGRWFDNGQHVFLRCCTRYLAFLDRIGSAGLVHQQPRLDVPVVAPGGRTARISRSQLPAPAHLAWSLARYRHLSLGERLRLAPAAFGLLRLDPDDPSLDASTFGAWLAARHQNRAAIARLWDVITVPTVNLPAAEASLAMAARVFHTGLLDHRDAGDIGWSSVPLGRLHGDAMAAALERAGVEVMAGTAVDKVVSTAGGFAVHTPARVLTADQVVVATPHDVTSRIVPAGLLPDLSPLGHSPIVNVHLVLDRRVTDLPMAAAIDSPVQFVFDRTGAADRRAGQYLAISLSAADDYVGRGSAELVTTFADALGELFPAARRASIVDGVVTRERTATFRAGPGSGARRPGAATALPGLALAGAWTATGWPATMEGAVRSGEAAAAVLLGARGPAPTGDRPEPPVIAGMTAMQR